MTYFLLSLASIFWGGNYVVGSVLVKTANPLLLSFLRWLLTSALLLGLYRKFIPGNLPKIRKNFGVIFILALLGQVMFPTTLYVGLQYTSALNAAIYLSATPAVVLLINKLFFKEKITKSNILGVSLSTFGVLFLLLKGNILDLSKFKNINSGEVWTIISALSWAFYCSFLRLKDKTINGKAFLTTCSVIGTIILLPLTIVYCHYYNPVESFSGYFEIGFLSGLIYLVLFPSWLAYLFWNKGILEIGSTRGEIYTHLIPLSGGLFSVLFLGVSLESFHAISSIFILLGIYFCSKK
ncbi:MAG: DMT family transporter [Alphaproteobacteria bacterium]